MEIITDATGFAGYPEGSLFLNEATGDAYRLRDWRIDWTDMNLRKPGFSVALLSGSQTAAKVEQVDFPLSVVWVPRDSE